MEPLNGNEPATTLGDATNNNNNIGPINQLLDPKERKRQREKARYAALSEEQKAERRRKQQEAYRRPEAVEKRREARNKKQRESGGKENVDPTDQAAGSLVNANREDYLRDMSEERLHTNDPCTPRSMPTISPGITSETRVQNEPIIDLTEKSNNSDAESGREENVDPTNQPAGSSINEDPEESLRDMSEYWLHTNDAYTQRLLPTISSGVVCLLRSPSCAFV